MLYNLISVNICSADKTKILKQFNLEDAAMSLKSVGHPEDKNKTPMKATGKNSNPTAVSDCHTSHWLPLCATCATGRPYGVPGISS